MIRFMLDTNICIYVIKRKPRQVLERMERVRLSHVGVSSVTLGELDYGVSKSSYPEQNKAALIEFLAPLEILAFEDRAASHYGPLRAHLERQGTPIGPLDTLIAAHALSIGCALVTNDEAAFRRVPGLKVENWAR